MKKISLLSVMCMLLSAPVYAESVTSNIKYALKHPAGSSSYYSVVIALGVVILLIYITGIIYAKLNIIGHNTMKKQYLNFGDTKVLILSTTPIGNNKSLMVVELAGKKMLLGVTNENITLIKDLDEKPVTDNTKQKNDFTMQTPLDKIYPQKDENTVEEEIEIKNEVPETEKSDSEYDTEEFGLYKKYLD